MFKGFRDFITRGNVIDLAVGVIIGVAFAAIVASLVKDVITPIIGMVFGQPDFSALVLGPVAIGNFLNAVISFLLTAAGVYFLIVVPYNRFGPKKPEAAPPPPNAQEALLREIRDLLAAQRR